MKESVLVVSILLICSFSLRGQTRKELEDQRKKTLDEISYVDNLLQNTAKQKNESINTVKILGNKVKLRENIITGMSQEISLLNERIEINRLAIDMMENDLKNLKEDYARTIVNSYKSKKINPDMVYILSARDFNQGYKRLKYLQQVSKYRRNQTEIIAELKNEIETSKAKLEEDLNRKSDLQQREISQKNMLKQEQERNSKMIRNLANKEKQLQQELNEKKKIAKRIETEIAKIIEEERKRSVNNELTPEQKLISNNFYENKGRLPWPVERGSITSHFGNHQHPVLKYVTEQNPGIEITSSGKTIARSIFKGEVSAVFAISGANMTVIIRHGNYMSVYSNLVNLKVKKGDFVDTKQDLGEVYQETGDNKICTIKLMIFEQKTALDPESWIAKS